MPYLELDAHSVYGAIEVRDWLRGTLADEGDDRPTFRAIGEYILSDINDAIAAFTEATNAQH